MDFLFFVLKKLISVQMKINVGWFLSSRRDENEHKKVKCSGSALRTLHAVSVLTVDLACENIRFSSLFAAGDVSRETSPSAKSEEKRMFSQATVDFD